MFISAVPTIVSPYVISSATGTKSDDLSFLTDKTIADQVYFQKLLELEGVLAEIYQKDQADNKDLILLNTLYVLFNTNDPSIMHMIKSRTAGILKNGMTLQKGHDALTSVAMVLDTAEKLFKYYKIVLDLNVFREKASDQFRDHIRDNYYLQSFGLRNDKAGVDSYYQMDRAKVAEHFKAIPIDGQLKELFWFSYSRMHVRDTLKTSNINTVLKQRVGDCTDFTVLNAFILKECGYIVGMPVIELSPGDTHSFVTTYEVNDEVMEQYIARREDDNVPLVIFDLNRMYRFDLKNKKMENISDHMLFQVNKIDHYLKYRALIDEGLLLGFPASE